MKHNQRMIIFSMFSWSQFTLFFECFKVRYHIKFTWHKSCMAVCAWIIVISTTMPPLLLLPSFIHQVLLTLLFAHPGVVHLQLHRKILPHQRLSPTFITKQFTCALLSHDPNSCIYPPGLLVYRYSNQTSSTIVSKIPLAANIHRPSNLC